MNARNFSIAGKRWLLACLAFVCMQACAAPVVGSVTHLSGPLLAKKVDGTVKVLAQKSLVEQGDLLVAEKDTHARIRFLDNSEVTLKPGAQFRVDSFHFEEDKPQKDSALFSLLKGGLRSMSGTVGKRNRERAVLTTPAATIGIRGTIYDAFYAPPPAPDGSGAQQAPSMPPGLHVQVVEGAITVGNQAGSQDFHAGQAGYVPDVNRPPAIVPPNPEIQLAPPRGFDPAPGGADDAPFDCTAL